jgi:PleD family two-component response regulator
MKKILIVDDERLNINVLNNLLKNEYNIMAAINGQQALKAASSLEDRNIGGLGIHFMKEFSDKYYCRRGVNKNILTLIKNIK